MLLQIKDYKKLNFDEIICEPYGIKNYLKTMTVTQARVYFSARTQMLRTVQYNFRNNPEYRSNEYKCLCGEEDRQSHLQYCTVYGHCTDGLDLAVPADIVTFYQRVISEREQEENRKARGSNT